MSTSTAGTRASQQDDSDILKPEKKSPYFGATMHLTPSWALLHMGGFYGLAWGSVAGGASMLQVKPSTIEIVRPPGVTIPGVILRFAAFGVLAEGAMQLVGINKWMPVNSLSYGKWRGKHG